MPPCLLAWLRYFPSWVKVSWLTGSRLGWHEWLHFVLYTLSDFDWTNAILLVSFFPSSTFTPIPTKPLFLQYHGLTPKLYLDECGYLIPHCLVFFHFSIYLKCHNTLQSPFISFVHISILFGSSYSETFYGFGFSLKHPATSYLNKDLLIHQYYLVLLISYRCILYATSNNMMESLKVRLAFSYLSIVISKAINYSSTSGGSFPAWTVCLHHLIFFHWNH